MSRVRVPEGARKVLVLRTYELRGRCFFVRWKIIPGHLLEKDIVDDILILNKSYIKSLLFMQ